jgi:hypothetical protein
MPISKLLMILGFAFFVLSALAAGSVILKPPDWEWLLAGGLAAVTLAGIVAPA